MPETVGRDMASQDGVLACSLDALGGMAWRPELSHPAIGSSTFINIWIILFIETVHCSSLVYST